MTTPPQPPDEPAAPSPPELAPLPVAERPIPRGCHPLVFGVVAATIETAILVYFFRCA